MAFWILTTLLAIIAMGFVCFPLLRRNMSSKSEFDSEQTLYKARLSEIDKDLELGRLDEVSADAARAEEARKLIKASSDTKLVSKSASNKSIVLLAALSLPIISIPFYYSLGSPGVTYSASVAEEDSEQPTIQDLLQIAEKRLESNPDDSNGWEVIAPVYLRMQRYGDAINAYENVLRVEGRSPEMLLKLTDVHIEQGQGQINEQAKELIAEVLSLDKENAIATFYTGIIALQNDRADETMRIWQAMIDGAKGNEEWLPVVRGRIAELKTLEKSPLLPGPDEETIKAAEEMEPEERQAMIAQMVSNLAEKLETNPDNKAGWERLVRAYMVLGRKDDARAAFGKAKTQFANDHSFITALEVIMNSDQTTSNGETQ